MRFNPTAIVEVLNRHSVRYVVIGAYAAIVQGAVVACLADVIASKRAAGRPKDLVGLPGLIRHLRKTT